MPASLTLQAFSDHDLLARLEEVADDQGYVTARELAEKIGIEHDHPTQCVGIRLGWLRRMGVVEVHPRGEKSSDGETLWTYTDAGYGALHPTKLGAAIEKALGGLDDSQRLAVTEAITKALPRSGRGTIHLARRSIQHNIGGWRDPRLAVKRKKAS